MKSKIVRFRFRKAQWQAVLDLPKSGRYSEKFGQAGKGAENTITQNWAGLYMYWRMVLLPLKHSLL
jgi:hypothetical protein